MTILIVGGTGATGQSLVAELLQRGEKVKVIARMGSQLPAKIKNHKNLTVIRATLLDLSDEELKQNVKGCKAVASCLGHRLSFKGIYGHPRRLVTDATRRLCQAIESNRPEKPVKFVLMNTTGNRNQDLNEKISLVENVVVGLIRLLLPPHVDNEQAAEFLRTQIGKTNKYVNWVIVRPDGLTDEEAVTPYNIVPSPTRSAIFNAGKTSRRNVAHFMAELIMNELAWAEWKGQMPVIYNEGYVTAPVYGK
ncbi:MAG: NAD(P)-binding oxidoreductase [Chloroflexota bacterium]